MQKKNINLNRKRQLQVFSQMMQMKFKPRSNQAKVTLDSKNKQIIKKIVNSSDGSQPLSKSTVSRLTNRDKKLKYLKQLSPQYFLVGNENQIDMICILGITHSFVDTEYCWSLSVSGPIDSLAVEPRKCLLAIVSERKLVFYSYNIKKSKQAPELIKQFYIKPDVKFIQFPKDTMFGLFYQKEFELYNVEEAKKIHKKCGKPYNQPSDFHVLAVPQAVQNSLKVFFVQQKESHTFGLWYIKINMEHMSIELEKPQKVYDIKKNLKKLLVIQNFSKDIIFMNIGTEILAAKNGYILDSANVNIQSGNAKLKYISNQRLIHISDRKVEIYKMNILTNVVPNKIQVLPIDALEISDKTHESQFFGIIGSSNDNFAVFYQNISQFNIYTKGEATYCFLMTQWIPLEQKIQKTFNCEGQISNLNSDILEQKCDMARKMGLNQKQLYLQIWNRSNKSSVQDYQFLLATKNYKTIHSQIERKLKKESMGYRQLLKIQESCLSILEQSIYGPKCTEQNIQDYLASHCFIEKLKLFKDIFIYSKQLKSSNMSPNIIIKDDDHKLCIDIQQYYEHKQFDIKNHLVQKIVDFCVYNNESKGIQIRMMLRNFKFVYRVIYKQILEEIIKLCKGNIINLLTSIPEILPYHIYKTRQDLDDNQDLNLYQGIWNEIKPDQWKRNLYVEGLSTIDNKYVVKDFIKSIWYKRYWLTAHQLINHSKNKIIEINRQNNSETIFYFFISKIFELVPDETTQFEIIYFLDEHYAKIPDHLRGKIFLYFNLYKFYVENHGKAKLHSMRLDEFLNLNDAKLFKYFFIQEKSTKNCILKSIKKIYQQTCEQGQGLNLFNQGLLAYFRSQLSQISDLKYLLNRMNNEKTEFHQVNLSIYEVLVRAMEYKLKLGSDQDIPIDEVLIYIDKIPISQDNQVMAELYIVEKINQQAERFKKMRINMTIRQIIDNCEDVIFKVVEYEFEVNRIRKIKDEQILKEKTYKILAQVLIVKQKIYGKSNSILPFFIYLTKLLESIPQIRLAQVLLQDEFLSKHFPIDQTMKENLVLYMYKWTFSKNSAFVANHSYIKELITVLPGENQLRKFIQSQTEFAIALSTVLQPIQYPISIENAYPRIIELTQTVKYLPVEHILNVDIDALFNAMTAMETITLKDSIQQEKDFINLNRTQRISLHEVYSVFFLKMIEDNYLNDAIPLLKKLISFDIPNKRYNTFFFIALIQKLSSELNDQSKNVMTKMISYSYDQPQILFEFIEYYFHSKETALQKSQTLKRMREASSAGKINFNRANPLFNDQSKTALSDSSVQQNSKKLINSIGSHIRQIKAQFQVIEYDILFSIMCNEPYLAAKFIQVNQYHLSLKSIRLYFSFLIQESIFQEHSVIQFCKKIFSMILDSNIKGKDISRMIFNQQKFYFNWQEIRQIGIVEQIDKSLEKTIKNFEKKKKTLEIVFDKKKSSSNVQSQTQMHPIHIQLKNPLQVSSSRQIPLYIFSDSDNQPDYQEAKTPKRPIIRRRTEQSTTDFNQKNERNNIMGRGNSFFTDIRSHKKSRNQSQDSDPLQNSLQLVKTISLIVPTIAKPRKIYVKRSLTMQPPIPQKNNFSAITQKQYNTEIQSQITKIEQKQNAAFRKNALEQSKMSRQQSQYSLNQISEVPGYRIKELIMKNYNKQTGKIDFDVLARQQTCQDFNQQLKSVITKIYEEKQIDNSSKIKIKKSITQKYPKTTVNAIFLSVYENIQKIEEKYNLGLPIDRMLPTEGIFIQSKAFDDLFRVIQPRIVQIGTDETIYKLSKLISLGFRKNIYEADISFQYIKKMIKQFSAGHSEVELNMRLQIMRSLVSKISILSLKQRAVRLVDDIFANPGLQQKVIQNVVQSVKKRGDSHSAEQIRKIMQKHK